MIPLRRRLTGLVEVLVGLGLLVGFVPTHLLKGVNPSPFFIIVIYGAWVAGPLVGLLAGLVAALLDVVLLTATAQIPLELFGTFFIAEPRNYLTPMFLLIAGYVFGELKVQGERRRQRLEEQAQMSRLEAERATAQLQQAETMLSELQGRVLGQTATLKRLYSIAQSLNVLSVDQILLELMGVLEELLIVEQASIYRVETSQAYARLSVRKGDPQWPNSLAVADHALIRQALEEQRLLTFADTNDHPAPVYLIPIISGSQTLALIAIHRLPMAKVTADTKQLLHVLAKWAGDSLERATRYEQARRSEATYAGSDVLREPYFKEQCGLEEERSRRYGIPYVLLHLLVDTDLPDVVVPPVLTERLRNTVRAFDMITWVPEERTVRILLPTLDLSTAAPVVTRIRSRLEGEGLRVSGHRVEDECQTG